MRPTDSLRKETSCMHESLNHSLNRFVSNTDSLKNETSCMHESLNHSLNRFVSNTDSLRNETSCINESLSLLLSIFAEYLLTCKCKYLEISLFIERAGFVCLWLPCGFVPTDSSARTHDVSKILYCFISTCRLWSLYFGCMAHTLSRSCSAGSSCQGKAIISLTCTRLISEA